MSFYLKDDTHYFFDLKTTPINADGDPKFSRNILCWYSYGAVLGIKDMGCFLACIFAPHKGSFWRRESGKVAPLIPKQEAFVADEVWDAWTGRQGTTYIIESKFRKLGKEGFGAQLSHHFD